MLYKDKTIGIILFWFLWLWIMEFNALGCADCV